MRVQHPFGRIKGLDPPLVKHEQAAAVSRRQHEIMHDKKCNRPAFPRVFPGQIHDDELVAQIERTRGFVQQQDLGPRHERLRHEHKLLLPAAQAAHRLPAQTVEPKFRQRVRHFFDLLVGHFPSEILD